MNRTVGRRGVAVSGVVVCGVGREEREWEWEEGGFCSSSFAPLCLAEYSSQQ
jgi:hypothetical protein